MYVQKEYSPTLTIVPAQVFCVVSGIFGAMGASLHESGAIHLPGGLAPFILLFILSASCFFFLLNRHVYFALGNKGLAFRFFPWQWQMRHIGWEQIRSVRIIEASELPASVVVGRPFRDFSYWYLLHERRGAVLCVELINGTRLFLSVRAPEMLMLVLHGHHLNATPT